MAEELGLDYQAIPVELGSAELVAVNPLGTLPAFVDGDVRMSESMAIVQYLAGRYGPTPIALEPEDPDYAAYLQFLWLGEASIAMPFTLRILNMFMAPEKLKGGWIEHYTQNAMPKRIQHVADRLA